ncbi:MAG: DUF2812 domain-containing protein [Ruminococcaceae bacterium]|nr:DUF2812 domain-containing protein [Oscillospiraceae bacterium]
MKNKKRMLSPVELWNPGAVEQWLEEEAAAGWRLKEVKGWFSVFEKTEPQQSRVRIHPQGPESREAFLQRIDAYEEMGWQYVDCFGREFEIFYCDDPEIPELFTDSLSYAWAWEEQLKGAWHQILILLLFPLLFIIGPWFAAGSLLEMLLLLNGFFLLGTFVLYPALVVLCVRRLRLIHGLRRQFKAGVVPQQSRDWRKNRRWWRLAAVLYVIFWLAFSFRTVESSMLRRQEEKIIGIAVEDITEETGSEWQYDFDGYVSRRTPLNPLRCEMMQRRSENEYIASAADRLRTEGLAEALYREKQKQFLKEHPEAALESIENEAYDEALSISGDGEQLLLFRTGSLVYSLRANVPLKQAAFVDLLVYPAKKGAMYIVRGG